MKKTQDICAPIPAKRSGLRRQRYQMLAAWYGNERAEREMSAHTAEPELIGKLLDAELGNIRRPENGTVIKLRSQWPQIVGAMFARFTEAESLRNGVLTLKVKHSTLLVELKPSCDLIRDRINSLFGENTCTDILLRI